MRLGLGLGITQAYQPGGGDSSPALVRLHNADTAGNGPTIWQEESGSGAPDYINDTGSDLPVFATAAGGGKYYENSAAGQFLRTSGASNILNTEIFAVARGPTSTNGPVMTDSGLATRIQFATGFIRIDGPVPGDLGGYERIWNDELTVTGLSSGTWYVIHAVPLETGTSSIDVYDSSGALVASGSTSAPVHSEGLSAGLPFDTIFGGGAASQIRVNHLEVYSLDAGPRHSASQVASVVSRLAAKIATL